MTDKYQTLRDGMPELQREAARKGGYNPRAQLIIDLLAERDALNAENERLRRIISDLKDWDCDVSGGFLSIPLDLRRRMQEAIDAATQETSRDD